MISFMETVKFGVLDSYSLLKDKLISERAQDGESANGSCSNYSSFQFLNIKSDIDLYYSVLKEIL